MESEKQITAAFLLLSKGEKKKAMEIAENVESEATSLSVEDMNDVASIYFANKAYDKALKTLEGQEDMNSVLMQGRILFDKGSYKEASFEFIKADQQQTAYQGEDSEHIGREITVGMNKCQLELGNKTSIGDVNQGALLDEAKGPGGD